MNDSNNQIVKNVRNNKELKKILKENNNKDLVFELKKLRDTIKVNLEQIVREKEESNINTQEMKEALSVTQQLLKEKDLAIREKDKILKNENKENTSDNGLVKNVDPKHIVSDEGNLLHSLQRINDLDEVISEDLDNSHVVYQDKIEPNINFDSSFIEDLDEKIADNSKEWDFKADPNLLDYQNRKKNNKLKNTGDIQNELDRLDSNIGNRYNIETNDLSLDIEELTSDSDSVFTKNIVKAKEDIETYRELNEVQQKNEHLTSEIKYLEALSKLRTQYETRINKIEDEIASDKELLNSILTKKNDDLLNKKENEEDHERKYINYLANKEIESKINELEENINSKINDLENLIKNEFINKDINSLNDENKETNVTIDELSNELKNFKSTYNYKIDELKNQIEDNDSISKTLEFEIPVETAVKSDAIINTQENLEDKLSQTSEYIKKSELKEFKKNYENRIEELISRLGETEKKLRDEIQEKERVPQFNLTDNEESIKKELDDEKIEKIDNQFIPEEDVEHIETTDVEQYNYNPNIFVDINKHDNDIQENKIFNKLNNIQHDLTDLQSGIEKNNHDFQTIEEQNKLLKDKVKKPTTKRKQKSAKEIREAMLKTNIRQVIKMLGGKGNIKKYSGINKGYWLDFELRHPEKIVHEDFHQSILTPIMIDKKHVRLNTGEDTSAYEYYLDNLMPKLVKFKEKL